jgi:hypothetical protein
MSGLEELHKSMSKLTRADIVQRLACTTYSVKDSASETALTTAT